jgi:hypothetical protein
LTDLNLALPLLKKKKGKTRVISPIDWGPNPALGTSMLKWKFSEKMEIY